MCVLALAPLIIGLLFGYFPFGEDALAYFAPARSWAAAQMRSGTIPLWNPFLFCGQPFAANIQTALWYPPNAVYWLFPERFAVLFDALGHTIWLSWGGYALARALGFQRRAAFLAGSLLALGGGTSARLYAGQTIWLAAFCHIPWLLRAELRYLRGGWLPDALFAGAWLGLILLAGHPPTALFAVLLCVAFAALWAMTRGNSKLRLPRNWPLALLAGGTLGMALSAVAWLPFRELSKLAEHGGALAFNDATILSATWKSFVRLLAPDWFGGNRGVQWSQNCCAHEEAASVGVLPLVLAISAFFVWRSTVESDRTRRAVKLLLCALVIVFLTALGANTPFYGWLFDALPPLRLVRVPSRWLLVWFFVAPFLAAWIWQRAFARNDENDITRVTIVLRGVALVAAFAAVWALLSPESVWENAAAPFVRSAPALAPEVAGNFRRVALIESATVFLLAGLAGSFLDRWRRASDMVAKRKLATIILLFACGEALLGHWRGAKIVSPKDQADAFWPRELAAQHKAGERWTTSVFWQGINHAMPNRVPLANGYDPLGTKMYFAFASQAEKKKFWETVYQPQNRSSLWRVAGVSHTLAQTPDKTDAETPYPDTRGWTLEKKIGRWQLWNRNQRVWPRVYLASSVFQTDAVVPLLEKLAVRNHSVYPVVIGRGPDTIISDSKRQQGRVQFLSETTNRVTLEVISASATPLVVQDANYPGWRAFVNERQAPIITANGMFRAVQIGEGTSRIEMVFNSQGVRLGIFVSLCGLCVLISLTQVRSKSTVPSKEEQ